MDIVVLLIALFLPLSAITMLVGLLDAAARHLSGRGW